jgi:hypothetical protein
LFGFLRELGLSSHSFEDILTYSLERNPHSHKMMHRLKSNHMCNVFSVDDVESNDFAVHMSRFTKKLSTPELKAVMILLTLMNPAFLSTTTIQAVMNKYTVLLIRPIRQHI